MKRHYANNDAMRSGILRRPVCPGGGLPSRPAFGRLRVAAPVRDPFEAAFAELLANEPPEHKGLVLAY